jgi:transcriptional regulator with XRE-family HTH domain
MNSPTQTGQIIRQRRKDIGLSQGELAEKLNLQNTTISRWETGEGYPDISILMQLTKILKVKISELLDSPDHENYLNQSVQTFFKIKNPATKVMMILLKTVFVLVPITIHILLFSLSIQSIYISLGTLSWIPFVLKSIVIIFFSIFIIFDQILYKTLTSIFNKQIVRLDNGMLAPRFSILLSINVLLLFLSFIMII